MKGATTLAGDHRSTFAALHQEPSLLVGAHTFLEVRNPAVDSSATVRARNALFFVICPSHYISGIPNNVTK